MRPLSRPPSLSSLSPPHRPYASVAAPAPAPGDILCRRHPEAYTNGEGYLFLVAKQGTFTRGVVARPVIVQARNPLAHLERNRQRAVEGLPHLGKSKPVPVRTGGGGAATAAGLQFAGNVERESRCLAGGGGRLSRYNECVCSRRPGHAGNANPTSKQPVIDFPGFRNLRHR